MITKIQKIGFLGAGSWGTALASAARRAGRDVIIHAHEAEVAKSININNENEKFLPGIPLDRKIKATVDLNELLKSDAIFLVMPAQYLRETTFKISSSWPTFIPAVICAKGIEQKTGALLSEIVQENLPSVKQAILSGPTFAHEVAKGLPTAVTLASSDLKTLDALSIAISSSTFRAYKSRDPIGVELGGAIKNVLAIGCGIIEGRKLGSNARAAFITRGLTEITRIAIAKGAKSKTLVGLSGLGDLTLTCNNMQSRNFSLGVALGEGQTLQKIISERHSIAEGVFTASSAVKLARSLGVEAPLCKAINKILDGNSDIDQTIQNLLSRPIGEEH